MEYKGDKGCDYKSHPPLDHSKALNDFKSMGIPVFTPYTNPNKYRDAMKYGGFMIQAFALTMINNRWTHTNADGTECPCYGFLIAHKEMGKLLYITDTELIKWRFKGINHILLGVNYDKDLVDMDNHSKASHVYSGHMSIDTACDFVKANNSDSLQNVIMCHLSKNNADPEAFIKRMKEVVPQANVDVAEPGREWLLRNPNECPF